MAFSSIISGEMAEEGRRQSRQGEGRGRHSVLALGGAGGHGLERGQCQRVVVLGCLKGLENRKSKRKTHCSTEYGHAPLLG